MKTMIKSLIEAPKKELLGGVLLLVTLFAFLYISIAIFG